MQVYEIARDFKEIVVALLAGYLAHVFQQRSIFVRRLHDMWSEIINAKNEILQYTHDSDPTPEKFGTAHRVLSQAIDDMRAVYANIGESRSNVGLFPFEPLHDMGRALDALGCGDIDKASRKLARKRVLQAWNAIRYNFRAEFNAAQPSRPITTWFARDPRRPDTDGDLWSGYALERDMTGEQTAQR